jgi:hypothetical protein
MGESQGTLFPLEFNRSIHVEARGDRLSSDSGALLLRELMERLGYTQRIAKHLSDPRVQERVTHPFEELVRTAVLLLAQGWSDQNDVTRLREDPALRLAVSGRRGQRPLLPAVGREPEGLCSQATLSRLMQDLGLAKNRGGLGAMLLWSGEPRTDGRRRTATLDLDSLPLEVFGHQPGAEWNGHYRMCCYHPLVVRSDEGVFLGAKLRPGNVHTADGGLAFVLPVLRRARAWAERVWLRIDAGFPEPRLLATLEEEGFLYVARLKSNAALERLAAPHLASPLASAPGEAGVRTHELLYRAGSWAHARRVVLVIVERTDEQGELFTDPFFLLSNASVAETGAEALLAHYRQRGTAEKDFGDWKQALDLSLSSTPRAKAHYRGRQVEEPHAEPDSFAANEARLLLSLVAANLLHAGAELLRREGAASVSRERFRQLLLKSAGRVLTGGRRIRFLIDSTRAALWRAFMRALNQHYPTRGSPMIRTLPDPA